MKRLQLSGPQARLAAACIHSVAKTEGRELSAPEAATAAILHGIAKVLVRDPVKPTKEWRAAPVPFTPGTPVMFQTTGRSGISPPRPGIVTGHRRTPRGVWIEVAEEGAAPGIICRARAGLVRAA